MDRTLYFDIDGVILDYNDVPKNALVGGGFQQLLTRLGFSRLVCVSGWSDLVRAAHPRDDVEILRLRIWHRTAGVLADGHDWDPSAGAHPVFPDCEGFIGNLCLATNTDDRARSIDLNADWYYVDDWAEEYFSKAHGGEMFQTHRDKRVFCADPWSDGSDLLNWLQARVK